MISRRKRRFMRPPLLRAAALLQQQTPLGQARILRDPLPPDAEQLRIHWPQGPNPRPPTGHHIRLADARQHRRPEQRQVPGKSLPDQQLRVQRQSHERNRYLLP